MRRWASRFAAVTAVAALSLAAGPARPDASPADLAQARERFTQARKLEDGGQWAQALELLKRVAEVKTTPQVRFHIALCHENLGLWTQALEGYAQAAREGAGTAPDVVKEANQHIASLEKQMPTVTVRAVGAGPDDRLMLDRRPVPGGDPPSPIRIDPGGHTAELLRGEATVASEVFAVEAGATRAIELRAPPPPAPRPTASAVPDAGAPPPSTAGTGDTQRLLGWIAIGVGGAAAITTGIFVGLRAGALADVEALCPDPGDKPCSEDKRSQIDPLVDDGTTYAALTNVFAVVTALGIGGGVALLLTAPSAPVRASGYLTPHGGGVSMGGRF